MCHLKNRCHSRMFLSVVQKALYGFPLKTCGNDVNPLEGVSEIGFRPCTHFSKSPQKAANSPALQRLIYPRLCSFLSVDYTLVTLTAAGHLKNGCHSRMFLSGVQKARTRFPLETCGNDINPFKCVSDTGSSSRQVRDELCARNRSSTDRLRDEKMYGR